MEDLAMVALYGNVRRVREVVAADSDVSKGDGNAWTARGCAAAGDGSILKRLMDAKTMR
jgi:hypothetical protein